MLSGIIPPNPPPNAASGDHRAERMVGDIKRIFRQLKKKIGTFFPLNFYYWVYAPYSDQVGGSGGTLTMFMPQTGTLETQSS